MNDSARIARCGVCQAELDGRHITCNVGIVWDDGRPNYEGAKDFCSFAHLSEWAAARAVQHESDPPAPEAEPEIVVDRETDRVIR